MKESLTEFIDLHTHSVFSDGILAPDTIVEEAIFSVGCASKIAALALSDHNSYAGCSIFMRTCEKMGVKGFVSAEISGSHPTRPDIEFHFLAVLGSKWDKATEERGDKFSPWFNKLHHNDLSNAFMFLEGAAKLGVKISFNEIVAASQRYSQRSSPPAYRIPCFADLRYLLRVRGIGTKDGGIRNSFEREVWTALGKTPLPTPSITECYDIIREVKPCLILAHPSCYGLTPKEIEPLVLEWKREIGLCGIESHYMGRIASEWKSFAEDHGLIISCGSDSHSGFFKGRSEITWNKYFSDSERDAKTGSLLPEIERSLGYSSSLLQKLEDSQAY